MSVEFDTKFGQELCDMLSSELDLTCSFMGKEGRIVASSARHRIGDIHDVAARIMRGEMDEYGVTKEEAEKSAGMREGVSMAIDIEGRRLINFGITGPLNVVWPLARIVRFCVSSLLRIRHEETAHLASAAAAPPPTSLTAMLSHAGSVIEQNLTRLRDAVNNIDQGITMFDADMRLVVWNKRFLELLDLPDHVVGFGVRLETIFRYNAERGEYGPGSAETIVAKRMAIARRREPHRFERERPNGVVLEVSGRPLLSGGFVSTYTDITERKRNERALLSLSRAVEQSPSSVIITNPAGNIEYVNPKFTAVTGYTAEEVKYKNPRFLQSEATPAQTYREMWREISAGRTWEGELQNRRKNGELFWERVSISPILSPSGEVTNYLAVQEDITPRKQAEAELRAAYDDAERRIEERTRDLRRSEERFRDLARSASDWFWETDADLRYTYMSEHFFATTGLTPDAVIGKTRREVALSGAMASPPSHGDVQWAAHLADLDARRPFRNFRYQIVDKSGRELFIRVDGTPYHDEAGVFLGYRGAGSNVTQAVQAEAELLRSEKLAALGGLVAGIAHEINTPVGTCLTGATLLEEQAHELQRLYQAGDLAQEDLEAFLANASEITRSLTANLRRAAALVRGFKQVAVDQSSDQRRRFRLSEYIDEILVSLQPRLKRTSHSVKVVCPNDIYMDSFPGALSQIITNLIINALVHAFEGMESGVIAIACEAKEDNVEIVFSDNGRGVSPDLSRRIFDPFFTTKRGQGGSGLGLHLVHNLVTSALGGRIDMQSALGVGTTFTMLLPLRKKDLHVA